MRLARSRANEIRKEQEAEALKTEDGAYHLPGSHADGLDVKLSTAHVKQIFETRPQKVDDEDVV